MIVPSILLFLATTLAVAPETFPLRSGCGTSEPVVATLKRGDAVTVRFALSGGEGTCYKVSVESGGKTYDGYLPKNAVAGTESFDQARQSGGSVGVAANAAVAELPVARSAAGSGNRAAQLLHANQPEEALRLLESLLRANRKDAGVLALAGLAAMRSDRIRDAVEYLEESLALRSDPEVEKLLGSARREAVADRSLEKLVGVRFVMRYEAGAITTEQARELSPLLDRELQRVSQELGCRTEERLTAVIQSREAYLRSTGAAEWSGGSYDGRIRVAMMEPRLGEATRKTVVHEIVHACLAGMGTWPAWLHEGLAQKLSGETLSPGEAAMVKRLIGSGAMPPLGRMAETYARLGAEQAAAAYASSLKAVQVLYGAYGAEGVRSLLRSPERVEQVSMDLDRRLRSEQ